MASVCPVPSTDQPESAPFFQIEQLRYKMYVASNKLGTTPDMGDDPSFQFQSLLQWWPIFNSKMTKFWISTYFLFKRAKILVIWNIWLIDFVLFSFSTNPFERSDFLRQKWGKKIKINKKVQPKGVPNTQYPQT